MIIETERLRLTPWTDSEEDIEGLFAWASHPEVGPNAGWKPHTDLEESKRIIETMFMTSDDGWAIREKDSNRIVGNIAVYEDSARENVKSLEMGYALAYDCWGKGYMTEAARAVMDYAFEKHDLVVMAIRTSNVNERSQRVIEKCGFKYDGTLRRAYHIYDGTDRDSRIYSITREEWEERKSG